MHEITLEDYETVKAELQKLRQELSDFETVKYSLSDAEFDKRFAEMREKFNSLKSRIDNA